MRKGLVLLGGAGIAASVAIALTATKKRSRQTDTRAEGDDSGNNSFADDGRAMSEGEENRNSASLDEGQKAGSMKNLGAEQENEPGHVEIDDHGTDQQTASAILRKVRDNAFESSDEKFALALGRPADEVTRWLDGSETIDGDVLLKVRALANQRGVEVQNTSLSN